MCYCGEWLAVGYNDGRIELFLLKESVGPFSNPRDVLFGHVGSITSLAYLPNYQLLVSASSDRTLKIWDISPDSFVSQAPHIIQTLVGHEGTIFSVATYRQFVFSASDDCTLRVWIVSPGREHIVKPLFELYQMLEEDNRTYDQYDPSTAVTKLKRAIIAQVFVFLSRLWTIILI